MLKSLKFNDKLFPIGTEILGDLSKDKVVVWKRA